MILREETAFPTSALPLAELKAHLRLGTGFGTEDLQDTVLIQAMRAAHAAIEGRTGKGLIERQFSLQLDRWRGLDKHCLPIAPVSAISEVIIYDRLGAGTTIDPTRYGLTRDDQRPAFIATGGCLPTIPMGGEARLTLTAGYGPQWASLPADLGQAVLILAAHYYENRGQGDITAKVLPDAVRGLIERYRTVRLFGGACP
ncbi:MAG: head-tail connector protein [Halocynthiibacter sp.]